MKNKRRGTFQWAGHLGWIAIVLLVATGAIFVLFAPALAVTPSASGDVGISRAPSPGVSAPAVVVTTEVVATPVPGTPTPTPPRPTGAGVTEVPTEEPVRPTATLETTATPTEIPPTETPTETLTAEILVLPYVEVDPDFDRAAELAKIGDTDFSWLYNEIQYEAFVGIEPIASLWRPIDGTKATVEEVKISVCIFLLFSPVGQEYLDDFHQGITPYQFFINVVGVDAYSIVASAINDGWDMAQWPGKDDWKWYWLENNLWDQYLTQD